MATKKKDVPVMRAQTDGAAFRAAVTEAVAHCGQGSPVVLTLADGRLRVHGGDHWRMYSCWLDVEPEAMEGRVLVDSAALGAACRRLPTGPLVIEAGASVRLLHGTGSFTVPTVAEQAQVIEAKVETPWTCFVRADRLAWHAPSAHAADERSGPLSSGGPFARPPLATSHTSFPRTADEGGRAFSLEAK